MIKMVLLTYDINIRQTEVKNAMKLKGYFETIKKRSEIKSYTLPNTTLWKKGEELKTEAVLKDLQNVIDTINRGAPATYKI